MSQLKDRLLKFVESTEVKSVTEFERTCGLSIGTIAKCKESVTSETLAKIARRYPKIDLYWLLGLVDDQTTGLFEFVPPEQSKTAKSEDPTMLSFLMKQIEQKDDTIQFLQSMLRK